jgi:predicted nucleic-acid-binding Zn-ribbon protein
MRQSGKCVKCECSEITQKAMLVSHDEGLTDRPVNLRIDGNPSATFFKHSARSVLRAYVCSKCGFTEFYADNPKELNRAFVEAQADPAP